MGYCQRLVTSDLDQANRILDPDSQARVLNRADVRMARDVPLIPLWHEPAAATIRSTIRGFVPSFPSLAWNAENWWLAK
jgi:ABC-type transport system substrate-binding protein